VSSHTKKIDVIIIGSGITGLSTAYHLALLGVNNIKILASNPSVSTTRASPGILTGGMWDNYTRLTHAFGTEFAKELWSFGDLAFDEVQKFCQQQNVEVKTKGRLRLLVKQDEWDEAKKAVVQLQTAGFPSQLKNPAEWKGALGERVLAVQDDGPRGGFVRIDKLLEALQKGFKDTVEIQTVQALKTVEGSVEVSTTNQRYRGEMVVLAAHLGIGQLLPELAPALVSVADQWSRLTIGENVAPRLEPGTVFSAHHGYEWGVFPEHERLHLGGARFLRPLAGIEATAAPVEPKIETFLEKQAKATFHGLGQLTKVQSTAGLDCRPCDELPIIGPMFGESRILVGTGYMGLGLSWGFLAGKCLANLVAKGKSPMLPSRLTPARLRSLEQ
jgi:glycine/D-amino acid oxidase-like deaminating enzyme